MFEQCSFVLASHRQSFFFFYLRIFPENLIFFSIEAKEFRLRKYIELADFDLKKILGWCLYILFLFITLFYLSQFALSIEHPTPILFVIKKGPDFNQPNEFLLVLSKRLMSYLMHCLSFLVKYCVFECLYPIPFFFVSKDDANFVNKSDMTVVSVAICASVSSWLPIYAILLSHCYISIPNA